MICPMCNLMMKDGSCENPNCVSKGGQKKWTGVSQEDFERLQNHVIGLQQQLEDLALATKGVVDMVKATATKLKGLAEASASLALTVQEMARLQHLLAIKVKELES